MHSGKKPNIELSEVVSQLTATQLPCEIAVVGDRLFTDVVWANELGLYSILVEPLDNAANAALFVKTISKFERWLVSRTVPDKNPEWIFPIAEIVVSVVSGQI